MGTRESLRAALLGVLASCALLGCDGVRMEVAPTHTEATPTSGSVATPVEDASEHDAEEAEEIANPRRPTGAP